MKTIDETRTHDDYRELLPWYVNGTLSTAEHETVARHVEHCAECRGDINLFEQLRETVLHSDAIPIVPPASPDRLLRAVDRSTARRRAVRRTAAISGVAATLLVTFVAGLLLSGRGTPDPAQYRTLTSEPAISAMDYVMEVRFEPGVPAEDRDRLLQALAPGEIHARPEEGTYRFALGRPGTSLADIQDAGSRMEALPEIRSARIVAVQLPVREQP
ncbi:MAG: zf-HC2 domain-containing protein [Woeseia sp.]